MVKKIAGLMSAVSLAIVPVAAHAGGKPLSIASTAAVQEEAASEGINPGLFVLGGAVAAAVVAILVISGEDDTPTSP